MNNARERGARKHFIMITIVIMMMSACGKPQFVSGYSNDPELPRRLGLALGEWDEIQNEFKAGDITRNTKPVFWARSRLTDAVEVHCVILNSPSPAKSGPVFFFAVRDGHWRLMREMSEWHETSERQK
jgi:hypothetical protein